jgi:hypothetical protein
MESTSSILTPWAVFYTLTGTSAASLTGLTFVVITLVRGGRGTNPVGVSAFTTPTVVHFAAALMTSGILCIPWPTVLSPALLLGLAGVLGMSYVARLISMALGFQEYEPDLEDWSWYMGLPLISYAALLVAAIMFVTIPVRAPFAAAAGVALLILIGIHNAWDVVTYITIGGGATDSTKDGES